MTSTPAGPIVLWLSSRFENIELAQAALDHVCRLNEASEEAEHWIGMALREAVANAIKHGNRQDAKKRVYLSFETAGDDVTIVIGDEGGGFDPARLADPLATENQMKTSGRGIFYIKSFMDEVSFAADARGGTVLTMKRNLKRSKNR